ncbi:hypothetical protein AB0269_14400 [Microbacterium sp. NPDC077644]|uniref:hypothetical protein n=1 Tax=Microbacterium sp. NPDC077644 TaxID=3155055 RepID=UPI00344B3AF5
MIMLSSLPIGLSLYPGETPASYWSRLCAVNAIAEKDLWLALRKRDRALPIRVTPRSALAYIELLGGLATGALLHDTGGLACGHGGATRQVECPTCRLIPPPVVLCKRCASGHRIVVARMHGPVCLRHRRWCSNPDDVDVIARPDHLAAQRVLNGPLAARGVHYRSPEVRAAAELLTLHSPGDGVEGVNEDEVRFFSRRVRLTALLTDSRLVNILMVPTVGTYALAMILDQIVTAHAMGHRAALGVLDGLQLQGRELRIGTCVVPIQGGRTLTPSAQRMLDRAKTIRAHLLHHRVEPVAR